MVLTPRFQAVATDFFVDEIELRAVLEDMAGEDVQLVLTELREVLPKTLPPKTFTQIASLISTCEDTEKAWERLSALLEHAGVMWEKPEIDITGTAADFTGIDADDSISLYLREVGSVPLLTTGQEVALAKRIEAGREAAQSLDTDQLLTPRKKVALQAQVADGETAKKEFTRANARLVIAMAKKYMNQGVPFLDLIQEGNIGLMTAVGKFDWRRGHKFSTYATWWIRQALTRSLANQGRTIRVPVHMNDRMRKVFAAKNSLEAELGRNVTPEEIARKLEMRVELVQATLEAARNPISLQTPVGEDQDSGLEDFIKDDSMPGPEETAAQDQLHAAMGSALLALTAREQRILELRNGLRGHRIHTLKEVGEKWGITRERIRQIEQEALRKLRRPQRAAQLRDYL